MTDYPTLAQLDELEAKAKAATPGEWIAYKPLEEEDFEQWWVWLKSALPYYGGVACCQITDGRDLERERHDAEFIAAVRNQIEALIALARAQHEALEATSEHLEACAECADCVDGVGDCNRMVIHGLVEAVKGKP